MTSHLGLPPTPTAFKGKAGWGRKDGVGKGRGRVRHLTQAAWPNIYVRPHTFKRHRLCMTAIFGTTIFTTIISINQ